MPPLISQMLPGLPRRLRLARRGPSRCRAPFFLPVYSNRDQNKCPQHIKANETAVVESSRMETTMDEEEGHGVRCTKGFINVFSLSRGRRAEETKQIYHFSHVYAVSLQQGRSNRHPLRTQQDYCHCVEKWFKGKKIQLSLLCLQLLESNQLLL